MPNNEGLNSINVILRTEISMIFK